MLSPAQFRVAAMELVRVWNACTRHGDMPCLRWSSFQHPHGLPPPDSVGGYLVLADVLSLSLEREPDISEVHGSVTEVPDHIRSEPCYRLYTYHILYSESYQVPRLYFNAWLSDGRQLDLHEVRRDLPSFSFEQLEKHRWTFLTMEDHPYLHSPWFTLHPCGTSGLMETILRSPRTETSQLDSHLRLESSDKTSALQYLLTWLSMSGEAVGLKLSSETFAHLWKFNSSCSSQSEQDSSLQT